MTNDTFRIMQCQEEEFAATMEVDVVHGSPDGAWQSYKETLGSENEVAGLWWHSGRLGPDR